MCTFLGTCLQRSMSLYCIDVFLKVVSALITYLLCRACFLTPYLLTVRTSERVCVYVQEVQEVYYFIYILSFSRRFYPKRLTCVRLTMYTHFTFTLMAHCTSGAIRGSVSCSRTLRQGIKLAPFCLLNDFSTYCTTVAPNKATYHLKMSSVYTFTYGVHLKL